MRARLLIVLGLALRVWILPIAHAMPIDADGPSGLSDNADFDDLIIGLTSPAAAVAPPPVVIAPASGNAIGAVVLPERSPTRSVVRFSVETRAPPLA
jgi:hypothetical protein